VESPADLRAALEAALGGTPVAQLSPAVERLITRYRSGGPAPAEAILASGVDVLAYAAYRMPATYAAVRTTLAELAQAAPGFAPVSIVDIGGGTGAAVWAATDVFATLVSVLVLDRVPASLDLGRRLAATRPALRTARWESATLAGASVALPAADLVTISYLLGELPAAARSPLVTAAARSAQAVVVVEPGSALGYARVLAARQDLLGAGMRLVAPCPHEQPCPLAGVADWCHFSVRINRSVAHRRAKGATLGYEDEKFAYVAAVREPVSPPQPAGSRVLRRPVQRPGVVHLHLCTPAGTADDELVSRRQGERYKAARDVSWGDLWR
jgi:ribosomal protein RSM22 (predicted rRNA methylase)